MTFSTGNLGRNLGSRLFPVALLVVILAVGCGGKPSAESRAQGPPTGAPTSETPRAAGHPGRGDGRETRGLPGSGDRPTVGTRPRPLTKRERTIRTPGGGLVILPPAPTTTRSSPSPGCVVQRRQPLAPPKPGLTARLVSPRSVVVEYRFAAMPARCRPHWIQLTISQSWRSGFTEYGAYRVKGSVGRQQIAVPEDWGAPPDVVSGSTTTRDGSGGSPSSSILVTR